MPIKKKKINRIIAWSHSRKRDYEKCPLMAKFKHVDRIREPASKPMLRGSQIHKEAEDYGLCKLATLPESLECFEEEFNHLRSIHKHVEFEKQVALTADWEETGWFDKDAWLRVKYDVFYPEDDGDTLVIIDHKTGKVRTEDVMQLNLYAASGIALFPDTKKIVAKLWYLDQGEETVETYTPREAKKWKAYFTKAVKPMLSDRTFKPTPGRHCSWCYFSQSKTGKCKF